jgi:mycothione reductase
MPHAIFSSPHVAGVGFTEQELRNKRIAYQKSVYQYIDTGMGRAIEDRDGFVKFLVSTEEENRKILGCHIIGADASILIHEVLVAIRTGNGTIDNIRKTIHIHPALSEVIVRAAEAIID